MVHDDKEAAAQYWTIHTEMLCFGRQFRDAVLACNSGVQCCAMASLEEKHTRTQEHEEYGRAE